MSKQSKRNRTRKSNRYHGSWRSDLLSSGTLYYNHNRPAMQPAVTLLTTSGPRAGRSPPGRQSSPIVSTSRMTRRQKYNKLIYGRRRTHGPADWTTQRNRIQQWTN